VAVGDGLPCLFQGVQKNIVFQQRPVMSTGRLAALGGRGPGARPGLLSSNRRH
jgi:hypothetical protein